MNTQILQLTESTWLFPHHPDRIQPSIGIITSGSETLLLDVGNSPSLAEQVKDALIENNIPEVTHGMLFGHPG